MNKNSIILFLLLLHPFFLFAEIPDDCETRREQNGWPSYYCECNYNYHDFSLPIDMQVSDTVWFRAYLTDIICGMSAYLHSDCDFQFNIYTRCSAKEPSHSAIFRQNQTSALDADFIREKLIDMGYDPEGVNARFYLSISPISGMGGRIICTPIDKGFHSSCSDALHLFPGMDIVSSHADDVYIIDPSDIPAGEDLCIRWQETNSAPCQLRVTRGACDGETIAQMSFLAPEDMCHLSSFLLDEAWNNNEVFYLHFTHDAAVKGHILLHSELVDYTFAEVITDTTICRGSGLQLPDTFLTESTTYTYDTIQVAYDTFHVLTYNLTIAEPEMQHDTVVACDYYDWMEYTYSTSGEYVYTTTSSNGCDSIVTLHLTINQSETVEETVVACDSYEWNGMTYTTSGDYTYLTTTEAGCDRVETLHLTIEVCSDVKDIHAHNAEVRKVLQGDRFFIIRGNKTYTLLGIESHISHSIE